MQPFSVLMSVYKNEKPEYFEVAMNSILCQTAVPDEIVLIRDGAVPESLQEVIDSFLNTCPVRIKYIPFEKNGGWETLCASGWNPQQTSLSPEWTRTTFPFLPGLSCS